MRLDEFDYRLPEGRVAQEPCAERDGSRLMVLERAADRIVETTFRRIGDHLSAGDLLVLNDTRVLPARLNVVSPIRSAARSRTIRRDASRSAHGSCATHPSGRR